MKIGVFTDPHYCHADVLCGNRRPLLSYEKVREALDCFAKENVSLVLCLGDLTDHCDSHEEAKQCLAELMELIRNSGIPFRNVTGNHDYLDCTPDDFHEQGLDLPPYAEQFGDYLFIFLDGNYRSDMRRFDIAGVEWTDSNLPPEQLAFLSDTLANADRQCIVCIHENLDPGVEKHHIVKNAEEARRIIEESGKVPLVMQGHYHPGAESLIGNTRYKTFPAMCEGRENRYFVIEL